MEHTKIDNTYIQDDIDFLRHYYPLSDWDAIFKRFPNKNKQYIYTIVSRHKIPSKHSIENHWTDEEVNKKKKYYPDGKITKIQELLNNRSYKAIVSKARRLGLKSRQYWSKEEDDFLLENYHYKTMDYICSKLPNRTKDAIIMHCMSLGVKNIVKYSSDEERYIVDNWKTTSDYKLGLYLNRSAHTIAAKRLSMGLYRNKELLKYNSLSDYIRGNIFSWKKKSMEQCDYKCVLTGERFDVIHHIYGLNLILDEVLNDLGLELKYLNDYTNSELDIILREFNKKQNTYPLGVCLRKDIHDLFHKIYGYGSNTIDQWEEFKNDFANQKYENVFNENSK